MVDGVEEHAADPDEDAPDPEPKNDRIVEPTLPDTDPVPAEPQEESNQ